MIKINFTTDDIHDERERMGLNNQSKNPKKWQVKNSEGEVLFTGKIDQIKGKVTKHFSKTARWSKKGRWRTLLDSNNYTIEEL